MIADMYSGDVDVSTNATKSPTPDGEVSNFLEAEKSKMSGVQLGVNLVKGIAGAGSLSIPWAFSMSGIGVGVLMYLLIGSMMLFATYHLFMINASIGNRRSLGLKSIKTNNIYAEMVFNVMGTFAYKLFTFVGVISLYFTNVGIFVALSEYSRKLPIPMNKDTQAVVFHIIFTVLCIIMSLLKDPTMVVYFSYFGLGCLGVSYVIIMSYGWTSLTNDGLVPLDFEPANFRPETFKNLVSTVGVFVFTMGYMMLLLTQFKYVKRTAQKTILRTTSISIAVAIVLFSFLGTFGFILFKQRGFDPKFKFPGNILEVLPETGFSGAAVRVMMIISNIGGFPLWMEPINEMVETKCGEQTSGRFFITNKPYISIRVISLVVMSFVAFIFKDNVETVLGFVGGFADNVITFMFPAIMHIIFFRNRIPQWLLALDFAFLAFSTFLMVICTGQSIDDMIVAINSGFAHSE